jgi:3-hydroxy-9,10-secoandrosta-1,3,5(10)-triene-9,17-dione monooxygenase reductase component
MSDGAAVEATAESLSPNALRSAFGHFTTGVTIVTCQDRHGRSVGLTVNSFSSLSLDPPLVLWSLRHASPSIAAFDHAPYFAVNVLGQHQIELSRRFASSGRDKFASGHWAVGAGGAPVLEDCVAAFECQLVSQQDAGDHVLFIGRVLRLRESPHPPLVYHGGRYRRLGETL